ncbi:hypothetical protein H9P43_007398 [Blastocladiella emersonii ATCC 22665]|nr:hypothetical protein H9P43_007398 [Blastocladiella emersonii ATCC 22665]
MLTKVPNFTLTADTIPEPSASGVPGPGTETAWIIEQLYRAAPAVLINDLARLYATIDQTPFGLHSPDGRRLHYPESLAEIDEAAMVKEGKKSVAEMAARGYHRAAVLARDDLYVRAEAGEIVLADPQELARKKHPDVIEERLYRPSYKDVLARGSIKLNNAYRDFDTIAAELRAYLARGVP